VNSTSSPFVACTEVSKSYADGDQAVGAISELSMEAHAGQVTAIVGPSGSGKTTLLHLIGGVEHVDSGSIIAAGVDLGELSSSEQTAFRESAAGLVHLREHLPRTRPAASGTTGRTSTGYVCA